MSRLQNNEIEAALLGRGQFTALNEMQLAVLASDSPRIILLSPTGTGKTVAFAGFIMKHSVKPDSYIQALIVAPARELARQIADVLKKLLSGYKVAVLTGGHSLRDEVNLLGSLRPDILIATPGRLLDHLQRATVDLSHVKTVVVDEMDKCLDLGFLPDIKKILKSTARARNLILTSATMPTDTELLRLIGNSQLLDFATGTEADKPAIEVVHIRSYERDKTDTLASLLNSFGTDSKAIVFVNHRESAERLLANLSRKGFPVGLYHGALEQEDRELAVAALRSGATPILIATDLAARGLDIPEVENVVHYHLPTSQEAYTHRNGRTARAGASGTAYVITHEEEALPEYITADREWLPSASRDEALHPATKAMVVFNIGKKEKISKGDILGFLTKQLGIEGTSIGKIEIGENYSAVTVKSDIAPSIIESSSSGLRIKNKRFKAKARS